MGTWDVPEDGLAALGGVCTHRASGRRHGLLSGTGWLQEPRAPGGGLWDHAAAGPPGKLVSPGRECCLQLPRRGVWQDLVKLPLEILRTEACRAVAGFDSSVT